MEIQNGNINGRRKQLFFCEIDTIPIPAKKEKLNDEIMDGSLENGDNIYTVCTDTTNTNLFPEKVTSNDETIDETFEPLVISTIPMEETPKIKENSKEMIENNFNIRREELMLDSSYESHEILPQEYFKDIKVEPDIETILENNKEKDKKMHECDKCHYKTDSTSHLQDHLETSDYSTNKRYSCSNCEFISCTKVFLSYHKKRIHGDFDTEIFKCEKCFYSSTHSSHIKDHKKTEGYLLNLMFFCMKCDYKSCTKVTLSIHNKRFHNQNIDTTTRKADLNDSFLNTATNSNNIDHKCESCGKLFSQRGALDKHILVIHAGLKDYNCESCGKSFTQRAGLNKHIRVIHEGLKDYNCELCGKSFSYRRNLKEHIQIDHDDEDSTAEGNNQNNHASSNGFDDKMCSFCEFKPPDFKNRQDYIDSLQNHLLKKHLKDHVVDELPKRTAPLTCPVLGCFYSQITNKFNDYDFLYNHYTSQHINFDLFILKQNTNAKEDEEHSKRIIKLEPAAEFSYQEKAFKCSKCHYTTDEHRQLLSHKKSKDYSSNRVHLCSKCEFTFCTKNGITVHLRKVHRILEVKEAYESIVREDMAVTDTEEESINSVDNEINMEYGKSSKNTEKSSNASIQTCEKCNYIGSKSIFSAHSCEKRIFYTNDGGYCPKNCGFFSNIWSDMTKHLRTTCKFLEENDTSQTTCKTCNFTYYKNTVQYRTHKCEKYIFLANIDDDGLGYCPKECGFFTKTFQVMEKHLKTTCQFGEKKPMDFEKKIFKNGSKIDAEDDDDGNKQNRISEKDFMEEGQPSKRVKNIDWIICSGCNFETLHSEIFYNYQLHNCPMVLTELRQILTKSKSSISIKETKKEIDVEISETDNAYDCNFCDKSFSTEQSLKKHIYTRGIYTVHEGKKYNKCEACGKLFSLKDQLKSHIRVKHGDKNNKSFIVKNTYLQSNHYKCDTCSKSFLTENLLKKHISARILCQLGRNLTRTDIQEYKKYKCDTCEKYFSTEDKFEKHISSMHGEKKVQKQYDCECGHIFKNLSNFSAHNKKCHSKPNIKEENSKEEIRKCEKCGFIGSQKLSHNCEKTQFESKGGGYCANNCGYFTKLWQNMRNHTRVLICKAKNTSSSFSQKHSTTNISDSSLSQTLNCDNFIEEMSPPALPDSNGFYSKQDESKTSEKLKKWLHEKVILKENIDDVTTKTTNYVKFVEKNQLLTTKNYFPSAADVKDSIGKNLKVVKIVETSVENFEKSIKIVHPSSTTNLKSSSSEIFSEESQAAENNFFKENNIVVKDISNIP